MADETFGGFDYDFVDTPLENSLCKICCYPSREAQLSLCCGHTFCKSCLDGTKKSKFTSKLCPMCCSGEFTSVHNKQVDRLVKSLLVFCSNKEKGCEWQGEVNDINKHLGSCHFEDLSCTNDCGVHVQRQNLTKHIETECVRRKVDCQYCHITEEYQSIEGEHKEQCPKLPLPCPNKCDISNIPREQINQHRKICPLEKVECVDNCGKSLMRQDLRNHEMECVRRKVNCKYCHLIEDRYLIEGQHKEECLKFPLSCPNKCDIGIITRGDIEEHLKTCPLEVIQCEYYEVGCADVITRKDRVKHNKEEMEKHLSYTKLELTTAKQQLAALETTLLVKITSIESAAQRRINELESQLQNTFQYCQWLNMASIKSLSGNETCPAFVKVPGYIKTKTSHQVWYSETFFSHNKGYKLRLCVIPGGYGDGKDTHVSVYLYLLKGPNDANLPWPVHMDVKVMLLNQVADRDHHAMTTKIVASRVSLTKTLVCNVDRFICYQDLYTLSTSCLFLKDDSIFFKINCLSPVVVV
ncbi:TNF receptor-associated factor 4-like [Dysidea avara]|uniref:TNF receptor-associated factor 4-like n=1 Tax=Dysidea avara TaxID=196820 RepID=UPI003321F8FF